MTKSQEILIVEDEQDIGRLIAESLEDEGYQTRHAANGAIAIDMIKSRCPNLVILDIWLGDSKFDGIRVLEMIKKDLPYLPVVMMSGHGTIETAVAAIKKGAYDFIEKPFKMNRMLLVVERALEAAHLKRENQELKNRQADEYTMNTAAIIPVNLMPIVSRVAPTSSRIMIFGPSGSGKEMLAHMIHQLSQRKKGPFHILNCAMLEPSSVEAELFGLENAGGIRLGALEKAHQGSLLLDEVADLSLEVQSKMVRALQEQSFTRIHGNNKVHVDVRVLSSTRYEIQSLINEGKFREDLYYRLNVVPISMPSLKERIEDLPRLVDLFAEMLAKTNILPKKNFSADALLTMKTHDWPGNLRQLKNCIDWVLIMTQDNDCDVITPDMLPTDIMSQTPISLQNNQVLNFVSLPLREARESFEKDYLNAQILRFDGNISRTANFVGMERSALHRKLKSLKVKNIE